MSQSSDRRQWEQRLPPLDGLATHWLIEADGIRLGSFSSVTEILDIVEETQAVYDRIAATAVVLDDSGKIVEKTGRLTALWSRLDG